MVKAFILVHRRNNYHKIFVKDIKKVIRTPKRKIPSIPYIWPE